MHNISEASGRPEMAYVGETPWHGLGVRLDRVATSDEMLVAAGLDWEVEKTPLFYRGLDGEIKLVPGKVGIRRLDVDQVLADVGESFKPVQNRDAFRILDDIAGTSGAIFHTAGALKGGRKVWALVKLPQSITVGPDDTVDQYLLMANGHDGTVSLAFRFTPIRVVCWNTLSAAMDMDLDTGQLRHTADGVYIRHSENADVRIEEVKRALGIATRSFDEAGKVYQAMAATQISSALLKGYLEAVVPMTLKSLQPTDDDLEAAATKQKDTHEAIIRCFETGRGSDLATANGTIWGAYNAVGEWVDHVYPVLQDGNVSKSRQESALFGTYGQMKRRAYSEAVALVARS